MAGNNGMAMMLKAMGIDPEQIVTLVMGIVERADLIMKKLESIETRLERMENEQHGYKHSGTAGPDDTADANGTSAASAYLEPVRGLAAGNERPD